MIEAQIRQLESKVSNYKQRVQLSEKAIIEVLPILPASKYSDLALKRPMQTILQEKNRVRQEIVLIQASKADVDSYNALLEQKETILDQLNQIRTI